MKKFFYLFLVSAFTFAFSNAATAQQNKNQVRDVMPPSEQVIKSAQAAKDRPTPETKEMVVPTNENKNQELNRQETTKKNKPVSRPKVIIETPQIKTTVKEAPIEK